MNRDLLRRWLNATSFLAAGRGVSLGALGDPWVESWGPHTETHALGFSFYD